MIRRSAPARAPLPALALALLAAQLGAGVAAAQPAPAPAAPEERPTPNGGELVQLDFNNAELNVVIDTIAKLTGKNFIYDDRVRGRVTVVSPTRITVDEAYAVFESVLQVKGFTTVPTPGGALKVIPMRDAKETSVPTDQSSRPPMNRDLFITRLIPLQYIDAESIVNTLKPLVSKDAAIAAYQPTNTVILTESASNIRRLIAIIEAIDVDTYREDLALIHLEYADAATMAQQLSDIYGVEVAGTPAPGVRARRATPAQPQAAVVQQSPLRNVRIITDERTNSLIVLAARAQIEEVRNLARKLDVPVAGGGRVHVYYLQHADAEELAQTLSSLITGAPSPGAGGVPGGPGGAAGQAQALRTVVAGLAEGVTVTADPPTNSLVIQASQEGYSALAAVIERLDIERPQVLVEALIMEVDVSDGHELGFDGLYRLLHDNTDIIVASNTAGRALGSAVGGAVPTGLPAFFANAIRDTIRRDDMGNPVAGQNGSTIQGLLTAAANDDSVNVISAPHILTSDNEEAEIRVGDNIPIITSRVESAQGITTTPDGNLATSVNVERQDIGVTLRVTPQITEGETLRLEIFQEITQFNNTLTEDLAESSGQSGPALTSRKVENTVVVADGETVVIGGILADVYEDNVTKVPWLGDIPWIGWAFKTEKRTLRKTNLLVFLTPHIVRTEADLERETIRKREEFRQRTEDVLGLDSARRERELARRREDLQQGLVPPMSSKQHPARDVLLNHEARYPLERMREIEEQRQLESKEKEAAARRAGAGYLVQATVLGDEQAALDTHTRLADAGYDAAVVASPVGTGVVYEVQVGPYESLEDAQRAGEAIRRSEGLTPALIVLPPEPERE